jgi:hypothetical protein
MTLIFVIFPYIHKTLDKTDLNERRPYTALKQRYQMSTAAASHALTDLVAIEIIALINLKKYPNDIHI